MSKSTRSLSGAAKNSFLDGIVRSALGDDHVARERLLEELTAAVASLRVRIESERANAPDSKQKAPPPLPEDHREFSHEGDDLTPAAVPFDPYTPNVIVLLRTKGRDAVLAALRAIDNEPHLRQLAHEQQLGLPPYAKSLSDIRGAIVASAERRVANRQAAGR